MMRKLSDSFLSRWVGDSPLRQSLWTMRRDFGTAIALSATINLFMLAPSLYMLQVFDRVMLSQNTLTLAMISLITVFFFALIGVSEWLRTRLLVQVGLRFETLLSSRVFNAANQARIARGAHRPDDALVDLAGLRQFLTGNGLAALFDLPWAPIYMIVLFLLHPLLGLLTLAGALLLGWLSHLQQKQTRAPLAAAQDAARQLNRFVLGKLRNSEVIEAMGMQESLGRRWLQRHRAHSGLQRGSQQVANRVDTFTKFVRYSLQSLSLGAGALLVIHDELTIGGMFVGSILLGKALQPIELIIGQRRALGTARESFARIEALLHAHPAAPEAAAAWLLAAPIRQLQLQGVAAWTPERKRLIVQPLDLEFVAGQVTAILGPSGSGKSTLARVLVGVWPAVDGEILIDRRPRGDYDEIDLGRRVGYVPQDIELFDGTIAENIARFGEVDAEEVIRAATVAQLHDYILHFPNGYDTPIGEAGSKLSGGQRQRIALARALYGDPDLIVLDEPNANLDEVGDRALAAAVAQLKSAGKIVVFISHRPGLMKSADRLVILQAGSVAFAGSPAEFVAKRQEAQASARNQHVE